MKKELQSQLQQQQQEQLLLQHPYMSLYEPVLQPQVNYFSSPSPPLLLPSSSPSRQRPDKTFSFAVAEQPQPQPRRQHQRQRQHQMEQEEEQEEHPYMSLYEPLLLQAGPEELPAEAEAEADPYSSSSSLSLSLSSLQQQQSEEVSCSSYAAVAKQLAPSSQSRINTTTATTIYYRQNNNKKRQKVDRSENGIAENTIQSVVHKHEHEDMNTTTNDLTTTNHIDIDIDNIYSSDYEAIIERMKLATKKSNKKSKPSAAASAAVTATARSVGDKSSESSSDPGDNNAAIRRINTTDTKNDLRWNEMYRRLFAYNKANNHCNVPNNYEKDPQLGRWVNKQRIIKRKKKMAEERKRLLNFVGFEWDPSKNLWKNQLRRKRSTIIPMFQTDTRKIYHLHIGLIGNKLTTGIKR